MYTIFRKHFRIVKEDRITGILPYRIQQRHTILFFLHFWSSPEFAPPHLFDNYANAHKFIRTQYPNAIIDSNVPYE